MGNCREDGCLCCLALVRNVVCVFSTSWAVPEIDSLFEM